MQKLFIIRESDKGIDEVENFIGKTGTIISATPFGITSSAGGQSGFNNDRCSGRILVVADDGKGQDVSL